MSLLDSNAKARKNAHAPHAESDVHDRCRSNGGNQRRAGALEELAHTPTRREAAHRRELAALFAGEHQLLEVRVLDDAQRQVAVHDRVDQHLLEILLRDLGRSPRQPRVGVLNDVILGDGGNVVDWIANVKIAPQLATAAQASGVYRVRAPRKTNLTRRRRRRLLRIRLHLALQALRGPRRSRSRRRRLRSRRRDALVRDAACFEADPTDGADQSGLGASREPRRRCSRRICHRMRCKCSTWANNRTALQKVHQLTQHSSDFSSVLCVLCCVASKKFNFHSFASC